MIYGTKNLKLPRRTHVHLRHQRQTTPSLPPPLSPSNHNMMPGAMVAHQPSRLISQIQSKLDVNSVVAEGAD